MVNKVSVGMIDTTMKEYVDDMLIKFIKAIDHMRYLKHTFECIWCHQVCLNPEQ